MADTKASTPHARKKPSDTQGSFQVGEKAFSFKSNIFVAPLLILMSYFLTLCLWIVFYFSSAPEVLMGKPYDTQCDMWAVGVIAYIL